MNDRPKSVIRETDADAIRLAKTLIRTARFGALAALDPADEWPLVSRVGVATAVDGTPLILVSALSAHTQALVKDARCSLLLGEPSKGDPLAYPRISLVCRADRQPRDDDAESRGRYLTRHPKAKLYAELGDFSFFRLEFVRASLNGGFGRAYQLSVTDLLTAGPVADFAVEEQALVATLGKQGQWRVSGIDPEGIDLMSGEKCKRVFFDQPLQDVTKVESAWSAIASTLQ